MNDDGRPTDARKQVRREQGYERCLRDEHFLLSRQSINQNKKMLDYPGAISFAALSQGRLVYLQRVRGAESDRSL